MLKLAPSARAEQRCNARAMGVVSREHKDMQPDELVAYAFQDSVITAAEVNAPGGAIRSHGAWYRISYHCITSADGLEVQEFDYRLGSAVPRAQWADHYLVPE